MKAEIISVGTELLLGHVINADAAYVARMLADLGIGITRIQTVGDNAVRLKAALKLAAQEADIIITTGGLGPTADDLTRETCAEFAGADLKENKNALAALKEYFGERLMTENQFKQALVPAGATVFPNRCGTAPGCAIPFGHKQFIILLPGPPSELNPMLENSVKPFLENMTQGSIVSSMIRTFGVGEGKAASILGSMLESANPTVAPYASAGEMFVKVTARATDPVAAAALSRPVIEDVIARLGSTVYGVDVSSLEEVVVNLLIQRNLTVAVAESCTGGLLAKRITDRPGSSNVFHLGLVTYSNQAKKELLHVPAAILSEHGAVSEQTAFAMAENVASIANADFGIGITGIAGPDGGTAAKPVGLVFIALAWHGGRCLRIMQPKGKYNGRNWTRNRAASHALDLLRRHLLDLPLELDE